MDSYSYRDGPGRSPPERGWNTRDDRVKEERIDSFYRGRSPGMFSFLIQGYTLRHERRLLIRYLDFFTSPAAADSSFQNHAIQCIQLTSKIM